MFRQGIPGEREDIDAQGSRTHTGTKWLSDGD